MSKSNFLFLFLSLVFISSVAVAGDNANVWLYTEWQAPHATSGSMGIGFFDANGPEYDRDQWSAGTHNGHSDDHYSVEQYWSSESRVNVNRNLGFVPSAVSLDPGHSLATASGFADANNLSVGLHNWTWSMGPDAYSEGEATVQNTFTILAGTSGLHTGDEVLLSWDFHYVGHLGVSALTFPGSGDASVRIDAGGSIQNLSQLVCDEGCYSPTVAWWGHNAEAEAYDVNPDYWKNQIGYIYFDESWRASTNLSSYESDNNLFEETWYRDSDPGDAPIDNRWSVAFDNDDLTNPFVFSAHIGDTLIIESELYSFIWSHGDASAVGDMFGTLESTVNAETSGIEIAWQFAPDSPSAPPTSSVPEPASMLLLGSGMAAAIMRRLRK